MYPLPERTLDEPVALEQEPDARPGEHQTIFETEAEGLLALGSSKVWASSPGSTGSYPAAPPADCGPPRRLSSATSASASRFRGGVAGATEHAVLRM